MKINFGGKENNFEFMNRLGKILKQINFSKIRIANAYFVATVSITFVLILVGVILLILFNAQKLVSLAKENIQLTVIIKPDVSEGEILMFQKQLDNQEFVRYTEYISKHQALEEMKSFLGSEIVDVLDYNPLPPVINVYLKPQYSSFDSLEVISGRLMNYDIVDDVFFNKSIVYNLNKNLQTVSLILSVITFLFILIALSLVNNTIRLVIFTKRQEIRTMRLIGASSWFILKPFVINAGIQGLLAALLANAVVVGSLAWIQLKSSIPLKIYNLEMTIVLIFIFGFVLTVIATILAVQKFILAKEEDIWLI